jgi:hypothetical protein|tara:strand:+ start:734 stop:1114 length:381 start_codon:yes stop_codon:yes gene_type:complete
MGKTNFGTVFEDDAITEELTGTKTLDEEDVGKILTVKTDAFVITLPATVVGYVYHIVNTGEDGANIITVSPNASDKIMGPDRTDVDDKDIINTKATAKKGDRITLFGDGSLGWYVISQVGTWAAEA